MKTASKKASSNYLVTGGSVFNSIESISNSLFDYLNNSSLNKVKGRYIEADERVALAVIDAQKSAVLTYLERSFDERRQNFDEIFRLMDIALQSNDHQSLAILCHNMVEVAKISPFKDLQDLRQVQSKLKDPNHEWEI
jgi:hypothetical protein